MTSLQCYYEALVASHTCTFVVYIGSKRIGNRILQGTYIHTLGIKESVFCDALLQQNTSYW